MMQRPLTRVAHEAITQRLKSGDLAIDATVGNGFDTLFLARRIAPGGRVIGFDVQSVALDAARRRLAEADLLACVELHRLGHERLGATLPAEWHGRVAAVTFNLGYLPGGDKRLITRATTTLPALWQALAVLRPGGLLSLLVYRGHDGAADEADAVARWAQGLDGRYLVAVHESAGPLLYLIERPD
jgi:SAM-dependent methyltransferase